MTSLLWTLSTTKAPNVILSNSLRSLLTKVTISYNSSFNIYSCFYIESDYDDEAIKAASVL